MRGKVHNKRHAHFMRIAREIAYETKNTNDFNSLSIGNLL